MFTEVFNDLLEERNLNRKQFAEKSGIPYPTVIGWTNLNRLPDFNALIKIADFFQCSVDYLVGRQSDFTYADKMQQNPDEEQKLVKIFRRLNDDDKQLLLSLTDKLKNSERF